MHGEMDDKAMSAPGGAAAGKRFGRYLLLDLIGRGGMAEVYRAVTHGPGGFQRQFVVKRIKADKAASKEFVEMFINEARISALLDHPNIVQIYEFGQVDGDYFLTMEYLRGQDLLSVLRRLKGRAQHVPVALAAHVACEVARGLDYAHGLLHAGRPLSLVHRDVTPSNIMLLRAGGVKLLDFGIARAAMKLRSATPVAGLVKGKLAYLSPEQVRGGKLDGRSDIFSLGVVLWECLAGKRLFFDHNDLTTMRNVIERPIPLPSTLRPEVSPELDRIVMQALHRDRDQRFANAGALADALEEVLREARFSAHATVQLLEQFFGDESGREAPLPEDTLVDGQKAVVSRGANAEPDPIIEEGGYTTVSSVRPLPEGFRTASNRRRIAMGLAGLAACAAVVVGVMGRGRGARTGAQVAAVARPEPRVTPPAPAVAARPAAAESEPPVPPIPPVAASARETGPDASDTVRSRPPPSGSARRRVADTGGLSSSANVGFDAGKAKAALGRGLVALQTGEVLRAQHELETAFEANPSSPQILGALAEAEFELSQYARALAHAQRAAALSPRVMKHRVLAGDACFKLGRFTESVDEYAAAAAVDPGDATIRARLDRARDKLAGR